MILHFAKQPPPIGGVTIHVQRLNQKLIDNGYVSQVFDYSKKITIKTLSKIFSSHIVHLHVSNKLFRLILVIFFRTIGKRIIVTFHGKYDFVHKLDSLSLKFCHHAILLNDDSFKNANRISSNKISLLSAFIPPSNLDPQTLTINSLNEIEELRGKFKYLFCTNAWNIVYDDKGEEIYGGSTLIEVFNELQDIALVFSDPKGYYRSFLEQKYKSLPPNVMFINYNHDFIEVIKLCDSLIRATTTDGDSLSVHEALYLGKDVITTNVVNRPNGCILYSNIDGLKIILKDFENYKSKYIHYKYFDPINELLKIYSKLSQ
jgi:hypothetical protein